MLVCSTTSSCKKKTMAFLCLCYSHNLHPTNSSHVQHHDHLSPLRVINGTRLFAYAPLPLNIPNSQCYFEDLHQQCACCTLQSLCYLDLSSVSHLLIQFSLIYSCIHLPAFYFRKLPSTRKPVFVHFITTLT